jgi:hypothetical protein
MSCKQSAFCCVLCSDDAAPGAPGQTSTSKGQTQQAKHPRQAEEQKLSPASKRHQSSAGSARQSGESSRVNNGSATASRQQQGPSAPSSSAGNHAPAGEPRKEGAAAGCLVTLTQLANALTVNNFGPSRGKLSRLQCTLYIAKTRRQAIACGPCRSLQCRTDLQLVSMHKTAEVL